MPCARQDSSSRKERGKASRRGAGPPGAGPGGRGGDSGSIWFNLPQFTSIGFKLVWDGLDLRHLVEPEEEVPGQWAFWRRRLSCRRMGQRAADDSAVARQRGPRKQCLVSMRGNNSKNESRLKSYGRFLNRFISPKCRKAEETPGLPPGNLCHGKAGAMSPLLHEPSPKKRTSCPCPLSGEEEGKGRNGKISHISPTTCVARQWDPLSIPAL